MYEPASQETTTGWLLQTKVIGIEMLRAGQETVTSKLYCISNKNPKKRASKRYYI
jgi:hypothetical protein